MNDTDYELTGEAEHNDFMMGSEDMELRAMRLEAERDIKAMCDSDDAHDAWLASLPEVERAHYLATQEEARWRYSLGFYDLLEYRDDGNDVVVKRVYARDHGHAMELGGPDIDYAVGPCSEEG